MNHVEGEIAETDTSERHTLMGRFEIKDVTSNIRQVATRRRKTSCTSIRCAVIILALFILATLIIFLSLYLSGAFNVAQQSQPSEVVCSSDQRICNSGLECIESTGWCNGKVDCSDYSDENDCGVCLLPSYTYANCSNGQCIKSQWVCDRESDCPMGEDEMGCEKCNKEIEFTCRDYSCITAVQRCDGYTQCSDSSDEFNCLYTAADMTIKYRYHGTESQVCWSPSLDDLKSEICAILGKGSLGDISITKTTSNSQALQVSLTSNSSISPALMVESSPTPCSEVVDSVQCQECGKSSLDYGGSQSLIGGTDAQITQLPWQVKILIGQELCGGSIIDSNWILTAAHCVKGTDTSAIQVTYGARRFDGSDGATVHALKYIVHPKYQANHLQEYFSTYNYDVALINTADIPFSEKVSPACLPTSADIASSTTPCYISGFGDATSDFRDFIYPEYLQKGKTRVWLTSKCQRFYKNNNVALTPDWICAGYMSDSIDSCAGDSGGPLVCYINSRWVQVGIVSWGLTCMSTLPSIYTRVEHVNPWIHDTIKAR